MNKKTLLLFISAFIVSASYLYANKNYTQGWQEFSNNKRTEARSAFDKASKAPDAKAKALLSLSLLDWTENRLDAAFVNLTKFYDSSDNPYSYLYAMFSLPFMNQSNVLNSNELSFYTRIVEDPKMNGTLKAMIYQKLGEHYRASNDFNKANELFAKMGTLNNWQVLGSFENISGSGFDKNWGAIESPTSSSEFKDQSEATVKWFTPVANLANNWFYFDYSFRMNSIIVYAQSFVDSPIDQEVIIRTGTSGSLKIWVNDQQVASVPEERNCDLDIYGYKAKLNKGNNRILVQIGQSEISRANFLLRITDENGIAIPDLKGSDTYAKYTKATGAGSNNILPFFAEVELEQKVKENPNDLINYIALGEVYLRNDKAYEGIHILREAEKIAPKSSLVSLRLSEAYLRAQNQTNYSREIENIKLNDPESFNSLQWKFQEAAKVNKATEMETICKRTIELYGKSDETMAMEFQIISLQKDMEKMIEFANEFYKRHPEKSEYMNLIYTIEENVKGDPKAALAVVEDYCSKYSSPSGLDILLNIYSNRGDIDKALEVHKKKIENMPYAIGYVYNYAEALKKLQRYDEALETLDYALKLAPYMDYLYNSKGYIYKEQKNTAAAKESFKKAIYYGPTSYDSREQLRLLENKKEVFDLFPKTNLDSLIAKAPNAADYPDQTSAILLNEKQLVFYPEGAQEYRIEVAVKIFNQKGIERWKEYWIGYNGNSQTLLLDKSEVIKANGQKLKAETNEDNAIVFTNLEIGDVLHVEYRVQSYFAGILAKHFYDQFLMQQSEPCILNKYSILAPKNKDFKYIVTNSDIKPSISNIEDMKLYEWKTVNEVAIKEETNMPPYVDVANTLTFSSIPNWQFVSDWYKDITANKFGAHSDYILKETTAEILKGKENASQLEKAKLFYEYILNNITYLNVSFMQSNFIPQKASRTISTRLGDCKDVSTLFVAFCREAGIKANLVLISTRDNGQNVMQLPTNGFNHCIAQLDVDGKTYYLELTDNKLPFGTALDIDLQSNILPIAYLDEQSNSKIQKMDMPFRTKNKIARYTDISLNNNDMNINATVSRIGQLASFSRQYHANQGDEDLLKDLNNSVASSWNVPVSVSNLSYKNLDNLEDSVVCKYQVEVKNAMQEVAGMKIFKFPWSDAIESLSLVALETRKYPLVFWSYLYTDIEDEQLTISIPGGKSLVELPKNIQLECSTATYELQFNLENDKVKARRIFTKKKDVVSAEEYAEFKAFITAVSENDNKQHAIR